MTLESWFVVNQERINQHQWINTVKLYIRMYNWKILYKNQVCIFAAAQSFFRPFRRWALNAKILRRVVWQVNILITDLKKNDVFLKMTSADIMLMKHAVTVFCRFCLILIRFIGLARISKLIQCLTGEKKSIKLAS